jgi:hypothetical protein
VLRYSHCCIHNYGHVSARSGETCKVGLELVELKITSPRSVDKFDKCKHDSMRVWVLNVHTWNRGPFRI